MGNPSHSTTSTLDTSPTHTKSSTVHVLGWSDSRPRHAQAERASRLEEGLAALHQALAADQFDEAQRLLEPLLREFADNAEVRRRADAFRWRLRQRVSHRPKQHGRKSSAGHTATIPKESSHAWPT